MTRTLRAVTIALVSLSMIVPAVARPKKDDAPPDPGTAAATTKALEPEVPNCTRSYGTVAIDEPDNQWWRALQLGSPSSLIRVIVTRSHCFKVVNRGVGLGMRNQERGLGDELQRGSNVGAGQVKSADFFLVPDLIGANSNAGGQGIGAGIGSLFGGGIVGGILGGIRSKKSTAHRADAGQRAHDRGGLLGRGSSEEIERQLRAGRPRWRRRDRRRGRWRRL